MSFLLIPALAVAQTSNIGSNGRQQLRRYDPQMQRTEHDFDQEKLYVNFEKSIPLSTEQAFVRYITQHYSLTQIVIDIYKLGDANNLYFVTGAARKDRQSEDSAAQTIFLILREEGGIVSEVSKAANDSDAANKEPVFFLGQNKILIIVSQSAGDGSFDNNYAYEYADNNLKPLGQFYVIEKIGMSGSVWITRSPLGRATAEYKNNTYYVTMRGLQGSLYGDAVVVNDNPKKLAPPRSPITFSYDGTDWQPVNIRQKSRR
jgi:hypothetical protein